MIQMQQRLYQTAVLLAALAALGYSPAAAGPPDPCEIACESCRCTGPTGLEKCTCLKCTITCTKKK